MKARAMFSAIGTVMICQFSYASDRVSSYGSNPLLSRELFPQDISEWNSNILFFRNGYEKSPYWGDLDEPLDKPNGNYTSTGIDVVMKNARFRHGANVHAFDNKVGYLHNFFSGPVQVASVDLDWDFDGRYTHADGILNNGVDRPVPFDYSVLHALHSFHLEGVMGFPVFGVPAGLRINGGLQNTLAIGQNFEFTKNNTSYETKRTVWGWSTSGCAHIFGPRGVVGDAWLQNGYARGPIYDIALQGGATLPLGKMGAELGYRAGHQDYYQWVKDSSHKTGDQAIDDNFLGDYQKGNWSAKTNDFLSNLYGNITLKKSPRYSLNTFVALGYVGETKGNALSNNLEISNNSKDKCKKFSIEAAPNISIPFVPFFSYIDFAVQTSYVYSRFDNTDMLYVGGGQIETWRKSQTDNDDENSWQPCSYANRSVMNAGIDLNAMFPLLSTDIHRLGLGLEMLINTRFMYMTKYYGQNTVAGSDVDFTVDKLRKDFEREIQFATGLKLQYQRAPYFGWIELTEPLLRSLLPRTRVYDADGRQMLYEHEKSPLWMSMEGLRVAVYVARDWTLPVLRGR